MVVDTNVMVSGLLFGGTPARVLSAWSDGLAMLVVSPEILEEYRRVGVELAKGRVELLEALEALYHHCGTCRGHGCPRARGARF